jgi:hypothetical protein
MDGEGFEIESDSDRDTLAAGFCGLTSCIIFSMELLLLAVDLFGSLVFYPSDAW